MTSVGRIDKFSEWRVLRAAWVLPVVFIMALLFHYDLAPLEETHWDAPIYVELSKRAAETDLLASYHQHADDIQSGPVGAHWNFTRIGHILLLGEITKLFGATENALGVMQWLYRVFMALGITLCVVLSSQLAALFRIHKPDSIWWAGYLIAALTYIASDSYRGLQGHMVSEPPAFVTLVLFAVILLKAVELRSLVIGAFSGCLLFLLFFIRIDTILPAIVFLTMLLAALMMLRKFDTVPCIVAAGLVALIFYVAYAWWFSPLVNPQVLANFSSTVKEFFPGVPVKSLFSIVIAGGLLWIGACAAVPMRREPLVLFAALWLGLALLPMVIDSLNGRAVQVRMAFFIILPLLILSGEGWSWILRSFRTQQKIVPMIIALGSLVILMVTPYWLVQKESRNLALNIFPPEIHKYLFASAMKFGSVSSPSQYQEQDSRLGLLVRPINERLTWNYSKAPEIGDFLYTPERPAYLLWSGVKLAGLPSYENYINLFRYFGKNYPENSDYMLRKLSGPSPFGPCNAQTPTPTELEPVVFCSILMPSDLEILRSKKIPLYILGIDGWSFPDIPQLKLKVLLSTPPFRLYEIME